MRINENIFSSSFFQDCSIILAGKCDRVASVSLNKNAVVVETSYQMLEVLSMRSRLLKPPSLKTTVFIFLVEKCKMKLSGVPFFIEYVKRKLLGRSRPLLEAQVKVSIWDARAGQLHVWVGQSGYQVGQLEC